MRPNNQNKRSRGRNGGGRKHSNPLSRNFESNGPDVKIRGNAAHIADKYVQLARDAQASSDSVMAENYLQHAEHYFRIVSAAQAQNPQRSEQPQQQPQPVAEQSAGGGEDAAATAEAPAETAAPVVEQEAADAPSDASQGDAESVKAEEPRKPRERRPRRKPRASAADSSSNQADAPQPDLGELPAFLTGGGQTDAAE